MFDRIEINPFARRQTKNSAYSYFVGSEAELIERVAAGLKDAKPGYRDGVVLVPVHPHAFYSGVCQLHDQDTLIGSFQRRTEMEEPRTLFTSADGAKIPAVSVEIVLYSSAVLTETKSNSLTPDPGNWEIISINASPTAEATPLTPEALTYNHFGGSGGTATGMTAEQFEAAMRVSFEFWKDKAMAASR